MRTVIYYKLGDRWYVDLPDYVEEDRNLDDLERVGAFHDFLDFAAEGQQEVVFHMDLSPFEGADVFEYMGAAGENMGAYYQVRTFDGRPVDFELWSNEVLNWTYGRPPEKIFFKRIFPASGIS